MDLQFGNKKITLTTAQLLSLVPIVAYIVVSLVANLIFAISWGEFDVFVFSLCWLLCDTVATALTVVACVLYLTESKFKQFSWMLFAASSVITIIFTVLNYVLGFIIFNTSIIAHIIFALAGGGVAGYLFQQDGKASLSSFSSPQCQAAYCPSCGSVIGPGEKFCGNCGSRF